MRKHYIDNLRFMAVLLLFPYHVFMIYNTFGEGFYVKGADIPLTTGFIVATWPWFMPLLFVLAGISSAYALQKRGVGEYAKERISRLLIPLISGVFILIPAQTYFAERFHNGYTGGYFAQYVMFFTKPTDLTGYTGGFTPGHLWFVLYLFIISLIALPVMAAYRKSGKKLPLHKASLPVLIPLFILPLLGALVLNIGGKSLGEYFAYFILGYFLLADDGVLHKLDRYRFPMLGVSILSMAVVILGWSGALGGVSGIFYDIFSRFYAWITILALIGLGRRYLDFRNSVTAYLSKSSFSIYVFHQTWLVAAAYYTFKLTDTIPVQIALILTMCILATFATYELCRRNRVTKVLFGI